jgi:hypothetical protein
MLASPISFPSSQISNGGPPRSAADEVKQTQRASTFDCAISNLFSPGLTPINDGIPSAYLRPKGLLTNP